MGDLPLLRGRSALDVEGCWCAMYDESLLQGRAGSVMRALSILDIALWDRNARAAGLPLKSSPAAAAAGLASSQVHGALWTRRWHRA